MKLINPVTNTEVEVFTEDAERLLKSRGFKEKEEKPRRKSTRSRAARAR